MAYDALLFVTPVHRCVPAHSRTRSTWGRVPTGRALGREAWRRGERFARPIGAFGANHRLRQSLVFFNVPVLQMPEAYISDIANMFDKTGVLSDHSARNFLQKFMTACADWVERNANASQAATV